ncbi:MAG: YidH family protein [Thermoanaerobaculia bacterium]
MHEVQRSDEAAHRDRLAVDRTHLANERTLLAYARTALASVITGLGILKFFSDVREVAIALIVAGALMALFGMWRFLRMRTRLRRDA